MEKQYFLNRLNEVARERLQAKAIEIFGPAGNAYRPTWGDVFEAIKNGEIVLKEGTESLTRPYLMPQDVEWPALQEKREAYDKYAKQVEQERVAAIDAAMLDNAALEALQKFAKG